MFSEKLCFRYNFEILEITERDEKLRPRKYRFGPSREDPLNRYFQITVFTEPRPF